MRYYWCDWLLYTVSPFLGPIRRWMSNSSLASRLNWQIKLIINWTFRHITFTIHYGKLKQTKEKNEIQQQRFFIDQRRLWSFIYSSSKERKNQSIKEINCLQFKPNEWSRDGWRLNQSLLIWTQTNFSSLFVGCFGILAVLWVWNQRFETIQQFWNHPALFESIPPNIQHIWNHPLETVNLVVV